MKVTRQRVIQEVYAAWEREHARVARPEARYQHDGPSQYAEGVVALSAGPRADAELDRRVERALRAAGLPVTV